MNFQVISLLPEMILSGLKEGVVASSLDKKMISVTCLNPRKFSNDVHHTVDDKPFGGGDGMLMMNEPIQQSLAHFKELGEVVYLSARGEVFNDQLAREWSQRKTITLICGRYAGLDQRVIVKNKIREVSIGDFVLSGGELAALVVIDAVARHIPGVLGNSQSADHDSFANGLLEAPAFTRTREWQGMSVPETLLSGDHKKIARWKEAVAILSTIQNRSDLFLKKNLDFKILMETKDFFEKMDPVEKQICGLSDGDMILKFLDEAMSQRSQS